MQNVLVENLLIILNILTILVELNILELVVEKAAALPAVGGFVRDTTTTRPMSAMSALVVVRTATSTTLAPTSRRFSALVKSSF
jgi:hypothetical protein